jgi:sulfoxide reductase heme-binding subunit YedZ
LAIAPLRLLFPGQTWSRWLLMRRRYFGVAVFAYALAHALAYLVQTQTLERWLEDGAGFEIWTGWLALAIFLLLAATSNDRSVRVLRKGWKSLHRLVHLGALLVLVHWIFTAFDPFLGYVHLALLGAIESVRLLMPFFSRRKRAA